MEDIPEFLNDNSEATTVKRDWHTSAGKFAKGNPGKLPGSSKNKLRDRIREFVSDRWTDFPTWFDALKPKAKIEALQNLLPYCVSRLQSVAINDQEDDPQSYKGNFDLSRLSDEDIRIWIELNKKARI